MTVLRANDQAMKLYTLFEPHGHAPGATDAAVDRRAPRAAATKLLSAPNDEFLDLDPSRRSGWCPHPDLRVQLEVRPTEAAQTPAPSEKSRWRRWLRCG